MASVPAAKRRLQEYGRSKGREAIKTRPYQIYIAASFKHKHGVRLLGNALRALGCHILDWTVWASPPPGLTPAQRRLWMDTDQDGGRVYDFCRKACNEADLLIYYGASGQDAGVEVGLAAAAGVPVLGIRGPLEGPGLMLHGAVDVWVDSVEEALGIIEEMGGPDISEPHKSGGRSAILARKALPRLRERLSRGEGDSLSS